MIVAFLDILGFSALLEKNEVEANINYNYFKRLMKSEKEDYEKISENATQELNSYNSVSSIRSFDYFSSFSDSIVIGSEFADSFIENLCHFVAKIYIQSTEGYRFPNNIAEEDKQFLTMKTNDRLNNYTPILFRGGISFGFDVVFEKHCSIYKSELCEGGVDVIGMPYLRAYKLESMGKGPRLFCDESVINAISPKTKRYIRKVADKTSLYEIVWTIVACESLGTNLDDPWNNVEESINSKLLPAAINLYLKYYDDKSVFIHYRELLLLICDGIIKYAIQCNTGKEKLAIDKIYAKLSENNIPVMDILHDYLEK